MSVLTLCLRRSSLYARLNAPSGKSPRMLVKKSVIFMYFSKPDVVNLYKNYVPNNLLTDLWIFCLIPSNF